MTAEILRRAEVAIREESGVRAERNDPMAIFMLRVADWLEAEASAMDSIAHFNNVTSDLVREQKFSIRGAALTVTQGANGSLGIQADTSGPALAVARAYLGDDA